MYISVYQIDVFNSFFKSILSLKLVCKILETDAFVAPIHLHIAKSGNIDNQMKAN